MASTIQLKTGTGSAVPSSLTQGEVGINIDNGLIYYGSGSGNDVKQLESFTNITASGGISASETINAQAMGIDADQFYRAGGVAALNYDSTTGGGRIEVGSANKPLALMNNVTASGDISASGTITADTLTSNNIVFTPSATSIKIEAPDESSGNVDGPNLTIESGNGFGSNADGGNITLQTGKGSGAGDGGNLVINAGGGNPSGSILINSNNLNIDSTGNITASGDISSSGTIVANKIEADSLVSHANDANTGLEFASDTVSIEGNNVTIATFASNRVELNKRTEIDANLTASGNISASGNIIANFIETAKIPLIQYISTDTTSTAQGRVLESGHDNASDSFALEWDTPLFEDTDFFETGSVSPTTSGTINTFAVKQTGRYEINCNVTFHGQSGARPGINLGIFTSSAVSTVGDFRPAGPAAHAYVRVASPANGSTAAIPGFVIQLSSGSAVSMKVDLKDGFGATGNTLWSGSLSYFNMKKIG